MLFSSIYLSLLVQTQCFLLKLNWQNGGIQKSLMKTLSSGALHNRQLANFLQGEQLMVKLQRVFGPVMKLNEDNFYIFFYIWWMINTVTRWCWATTYLYNDNVYICTKLGKADKVLTQLQWNSALAATFLSHSNRQILLSGPALSRCNRCSCTGPSAMMFGNIVHFCQIHLALENSVETPYKFHC